MAGGIRIRQVFIPDSEFELTYARSSGPGGQNVNKVNSKAVLRWNLLQSPTLPEEVRARFIAAFPSKINKEGEVILASDQFRDQPQNREAVFTKLSSMIESVWFAPKKRKKSKPTYSSKLKAKESKRRHSEKKSARRARY